MLNSQKGAVLSSSPVLLEMAGVAYLDLCILYIHFLECQEHKRNKCCININMFLLNPAQAAKEHSAGAGSVLTHRLVNLGAQVQSQRLRSTVHCPVAAPLQRWPCSSGAPRPSPGWGACIWQLCVTWQCPSVSRSTAGQHHQRDQHLSITVPWSHCLAQLETCQKARTGRGFSAIWIRVFKSSVDGAHPLTSKQLLKE